MGNMWWIRIGAAGIISLLLLFWGLKRKRGKISRQIQMIQTSYEENSLPTEEKKKKSYIRIQIKRNEKRQINIRCMDLEGNGIGELLAVYHKEGREYGEYQNSNTLHLEQLYVKKQYRRKGIGKTMFQYLIQEMKKVEKEENLEFRYIYGEVGEGGSDNPRISQPFYKKMAGLVYGEDAILCYQHTKRKTVEELDRFTYYINRR